MLDTLTIARSLTDANLTPEQANAITDAVRQVAEQQPDLVTHDTLKDKLDAAVNTLRADIYRAMLIHGLAMIGTIIAAMAAILRILGSVPAGG